MTAVLLVLGKITAGILVVVVTLAALVGVAVVAGLAMLYRRTTR